MSLRDEMVEQACEALSRHFDLEAVSDDKLRAAVADALMPLVERELATLRGWVVLAPHGMGCASLQDRVSRSDYGSMKLCDCWKSRALGGECAAT